MYREWKSLAAVLLVTLCVAAVLADPPTVASSTAALGKNILKLNAGVDSQAITANGGTAVSRACGGYAVYLNDDADGWYIHGTAGTGLDVSDDIQVIKPGGVTVNCVSVTTYGDADAGEVYDITVEFWDICPLTAGANMLWTYTWSNNTPVGWLDVETTTSVVVPESFWVRYVTNTDTSGVHMANEAELGFTETTFGEPADPPEYYNCNVWWGPGSHYGGFDLDLYTNEEPLGACCFDTTNPPQCVDDWDEVSCIELGGTRWAAYTLCADLDPPCGQAGACCHEDYTCTITGPDDCVSPSVWLGAGVTCDECPDCVVVCTGQNENEPCNQSANNGCGATPEAFENTACNTTICGTCWADGGARDEDWWKIVVTERTSVTFDVEAEFPLFMGFCVFDPEGSADCADFTGYIGPYVTTDVVCAVHSVSKICNPGTYYLRVAPWVTDGMPCGTGPGPDGEWSYMGVITCEDAPLPPCTDAIYQNQPDLESFSEGVASQDFMGSYLAISADDFTLTAIGGTVTVGAVDWSGFFNNADHQPVTGWEVHFWADDGTGTKPTGNGLSDPRVTALYSFIYPDAAVTSVNIGGQSFYYHVDLTTPITLNAGTKYWIACICDMAWISPNRQWYWADNSAVIGADLVAGYSWDAAYPFWTIRPGYNGYFCLMPGGEEPCPTELGDVNGDGTTNNFDIGPFVYAVGHDQATFETAYPGGHYFCADANEDGTVNNFDISPFIGLL
ncbi:MAG: hypothetical protein PVJ57_12940 [Phycisphaerae bacterium]